VKNIFFGYFMETLGNRIVAVCGKVGKLNQYVCEKCDYICYKKYNWDKHLTTIKHIKETQETSLETKNGKKWHQENFTCDSCNKSYKNRSGLWKHKQKCNFTQEKHKINGMNKDEPSDKELIMMLIKENSELRKEQSNIKELIFKEQADIKELILEIVKMAL
jgi:hypothetical protein